MAGGLIGLTWPERMEGIYLVVGGGRGPAEPVKFVSWFWLVDRAGLRPYLLPEEEMFIRPKPGQWWYTPPVEEWK